MLKPVALALLLAWQLEPFYMIEHYRGPGKVSCQTEPVPPGFTCATVFNLDPPLPDGISSIRGGDYAVIRGVALILNGTLYTCLFDPPLKQNDSGGAMGFACAIRDLFDAGLGWADW